MGKESFKDLYKVIEVFTGSGNMQEIIASVSDVLKDKDPSDLKKEAEKLLELMDGYKEPVLPFQHVTDEQIEKVTDSLKEQYGFIVWSCLFAGSDEECANIVRNDPDYYLGYSEEDVRLISINSNNEDRVYLMDEFSKIPINGLIITGTVGRWNGTVPAWGVKESLNDLFAVFCGNCDPILYIKDGQLKAEVHHHDGVNNYVFYTCKEDVDPQSLEYMEHPEDSGELKSLVPVLAEHFNWKLEGLT